MFINDLTNMAIWWLTISFIGIVFFPTTWLFFRKFFDVGWGLSKTTGPLIVAFATFLLAISKILPFSRSTIIFVVGVTTVINYFIFTKNKSAILKSLSSKKKVIMFQEILFVIGIVTWGLIRAHQPDIRGLEKFMDFGFINSVLKSNYFPPPDMWFAGQSINYYWFGHYYTAFLIKITNIPSAIGYNLMLAHIFAVVLTSTFSLVSSITRGFFRKLTNKNLRMVYVAGVLSAFLLSMGGNFHTPFYVLKDGADKYWYPDATRFIGYNPETNDKTIHEFPIYSFVVSDLHAHLINLPFVLLFLSLLFSFVLSRKENSTQKVPIVVLALGVLLGIMFMTNAWDIANYSLVAGFVLGVNSLIRLRFNIVKTFVDTVKVVVPMIVFAIITIIPFYLGFDSIGEGVALTHSHTPLWQLSILWGFPFVLSVFLLVSLTRNKKLRSSDSFVLPIIFASWVLIFLPEFVYLKDIYIATHYRANTMFKLTYQAFVMFYLASGYIIIRVFSEVQHLIIKIIVGTFFLAILASILMYPSLAINSYYGDLKSYYGLSGDTWLERELPDQKQIIDWLNTNVPQRSVILEAPGDSYTDYNVISAYTGLPTVSGWFVHEWLWRGDSIFPQERVEDIVNIYTSTDEYLTKQLLEKYNVSYVIIDSQVREKYPNVIEEKFTNIGSVVFSTNSSRVYKISSL